MFREVGQLVRLALALCAGTFEHGDEVRRQGTFPGDCDGDSDSAGGVATPRVFLDAARESEHMLRSSVAMGSSACLDDVVHVLEFCGIWVSWSHGRAGLVEGAALRGRDGHVVRQHVQQLSQD